MEALFTALVLETVLPKYHEEVQKLVSEIGYGRAVLAVMENYWSEEDRMRLREDFEKKNQNSPHYRLLFEVFGAKTHFKQTDTHKEFLGKAFERLREFVPLVTEKQIEVHDLSKYSFEQTIGYTAKWVHEVEWSDPKWQESLRHHYASEPHHPEHHYDANTDTMPEEYLQESLLDMVASRWERQLSGCDGVSNSQLVNFDPKFLLRYSNTDRKKVDKLIREIQASD